MSGRCTYHVPFGPLCAKFRNDPIHVKDDDRMQRGKHVWRHEPVRRVSAPAWAQK